MCICRRGYIVLAWLNYTPKYLGLDFPAEYGIIPMVAQKGRKDEKINNRFTR